MDSGDDVPIEIDTGDGDDGDEKPNPHRVVFIRHGESVWNLENRFTGWTDVQLTKKGYQEAIKAG